MSESSSSPHPNVSAKRQISGELKQQGGIKWLLLHSQYKDVIGLKDSEISEVLLLEISEINWESILDKVFQEPQLFKTNSRLQEQKQFSS